MVRNHKKDKKPNGVWKTRLKKISTENNGSHLRPHQSILTQSSTATTMITKQKNRNEIIIQKSKRKTFNR